ncbi:MAG: DNA cytosine methyltransferase [Bauldia sp.]
MHQVRHNVTALFAGVGGFELGLHDAGHRTSLFCENDPDAASVLAARFPGVPIHDDVRETDTLAGMVAPDSDLLTAGFPCTDLSQAGRTMGFAGGRSSLIRETFDLLRQRPFPNLLIENVPNWRHLHKGAYLTEVTRELETLGYRWAYRTIDARAFGLPQRRLRIFLFATMDGDPRRAIGSDSFEASDLATDIRDAAHGFYWTEGTRGLGWGEDCVPTLKGGSTIGIPAPPAIVLKDGRVVTPDIADAERLQGFPAGWTSLDERSVAFGRGRFNQRRRWMLVGNAVNVAVSRWIGQRLGSRIDLELPEGMPLVNGGKWPESAWFDGTKRRSLPLSTWPVDVRGPGLEEFLSKPGMLLSARATAGFLSRTRESRLRFKPGFVAAIERHLDVMTTPSGVLPFARSAA